MTKRKNARKKSRNLLEHNTGQSVPHKLKRGDTYGS